MKLKVERWNNDLAIRIPQALVDELGLSVGNWVELKIATPKYNLEDLVAQINDDNAHGEIYTR